MGSALRPDAEGAADTYGALMAMYLVVRLHRRLLTVERRLATVERRLADLERVIR